MRKVILVLILALLLVGCGKAEPVETTPTEPPHDYVLEDEVIINFYDIMQEIGVDRDEIKEVSKIDDWANGPRYKVRTTYGTLRAYCNIDGTVSSIKIGTEINLYDRGFDTWKIDNFIVDSGVESLLIIETEDIARQFLNYPATADFPFLDWTVTRQFNRYVVSSYVEAQNAFGVPSEIPFTAAYWIENDAYKLIYFEMNGSAIKNDLDDYPLPEHVEVQEQTENSGEMRIIDGQIGEYGETVQLDGYEVIWYRLPAGKYEVTGKSKHSTIFVDKDEIKKNSDGYIEMENVATYSVAYEETTTIEISEGQHISLVMGSDFTLNKVE